MSKAQTSILLTNGTVIIHSETSLSTIKADVLIVDNVVSSIGPGLKPRDINTKVIECSDKIISPGFIDTHHHVWQTQLKGRHTDDSLLDYHPKGNLQFYNYTPSDIFWGELGGLLEAVDGGTTTIIDHAHMTKTASHAAAGLDATLASGIRSTFCYSLVPQITRWDQNEYELEAPSKSIPDWFLPELDRLCRRAQEQGEGKVRIGFGFDSFHASKEVVVDLFARVRQAGAKLLTSHWRRCNIAGMTFSVPDIMSDYGLLGSDIIISHATGSTNGEFKLLKDAGVYVSTTPGTETQMAHGDMVAFRDDVLGCLGADCHSNNPSSMLHQMQTALSAARAQRNSNILQEGRFPELVKPTTQQVFNLATIGGAKAVGLGNQIGSLEVGKQADIIVVRTDTPAMICAAECDPIAAVVRHASPQEIETVIVGGRILKHDGSLLPVNVPESLDDWSGSEEIKANFENGRISWAQVAKELKRSSAEVRARSSTCSIAAAREKVLQQWGTSDANKVLT